MVMVSDEKLKPVSQKKKGVIILRMLDLKASEDMVA